jgi:hypothetical protein
MTPTNPFERFDLDPEEGPLGITDQLRERMEAAASDEEREALRTVWEQLTRHPRERVRLALLAHPESRAPLPPRAQAAPALAEADASTTALPRAVDFFEPPSVEDALLAALQLRGEALPALDDVLSPALDRDPVLMGRPAREGNA